MAESKADHHFLPVTELSERFTLSMFSQPSPSLLRKRKRPSLTARKASGSMADLPPLCPGAGAASSSLSVDKDLKAIMSGGVVLSETQLGNMALKAKQDRTRAEQDKQLLAVRERARARPSHGLPRLKTSALTCAISGVSHAVTHRIGLLG